MPSDRFRRVLAVSLAGLVTGLALSGVLHPTPADAADTTWSIAPASDVGPDGRVSIRQTLDPGAAVSDRVAITNYGEEPATFLVYASDGTLAPNGDFDLLASDVEPTGGGSWIEFADPAGHEQALGVLDLTIPAGQTSVVEFRIAPPANATPGDHPAGVVAELAHSDNQGVSFAARVGVRLHLRVTGELVPALEVKTIDTSFDYSWNLLDPSVLRIDSVVVNSGNVRLGLEPVVTASGPFAWLPASSNSGVVREVLPGQEAEISQSVEIWPLIWMTGSLNVVPTVVGDDIVPADLTATTAAFALTAIPWLQGIVLLALLGAVLATVLLGRWMRAARRQRFAAAVEARALLLNAEEA